MTETERTTPAPESATPDATVGKPSTSAARARHFSAVTAVNAGLHRLGGYAMTWAHVSKNGKALAVFQTDLRDQPQDDEVDVEERGFYLTALEAREIAMRLLSVADEVDRLNQDGVYTGGWWAQRLLDDPLGASRVSQWMSNHHEESGSMTEDALKAKLDRVRSGEDDCR